MTPSRVAPFAALPAPSPPAGTTLPLGLGGALLAVAVLYALCQAAAALAFGVTLAPRAVPVDLGLHAAFALLLLALSRRAGVFLALLLALFATLHLGMAAKIVVFGGPVTPDDLAAAPALLLILPPWQRFAVLALLALVVLAFAANLALRRPAAWGAVAAAVALLLPLVVAPAAVVDRLDRAFGHVEWNQRWNYESRGPLLYLLQETARDAARRAAPPGPAAVADALAGLIDPVQPAAFSPRPRPPARPRNVHVIVLESFWDPLLLRASGLDRDPWVPPFRALWRAGGRSRVLAPVFGGYTANAEFEALCGLPIDQDAVLFEGRLRNDVPCLPRHLAAVGYEAVASHPNIASFWNRVNAYRRIGFTAYWSARDFDADDLNGEFLSDASLYRQVLARIEPLLASETPVFNYVLTLFGHLDYPLAANRPPVIATAAADELVARYVNTVYYKSAETMAFVAELRARDPDAVIVLFGDHLPYLGEQFGPYVGSGLLAGRFEEFTPAMWLTKLATPLIVIDGRRGPLPVGTVPMYHLPRIILDLLGDRRPTPLRLASLPGEDGLVVRPLPGLALAVRDARAVAVCHAGSDDPGCAPVFAWQRMVGTVAADVLWGRQHVLDEVIPLRGTTQALSAHPAT